jgi:ABC-type phosphate/phosphonate transport system permease subunit
MTPEKKLHHLKIILLALSITAVALIITALVLHSTNNMFTSSSELMKCAIVLNTTNKDKNISTLTIITTVMLIIGIVFSLTLAVFLVVWLIRKAGVKTSVPDKYRIPIYLLTALALWVLSIVPYSIWHTLMSSSMEFLHYSSYSTSYCYGMPSGLPDSSDYSAETH